MRYWGLVAIKASVCLAALSASEGSHAQSVSRIDVPSQPLGDAITEFTEETGLTVLARKDVLDNKNSTAVSGDMPADEALDKMLSGTGLIVRAVDGGSLALQNDVSQDAQSFDLGTLVLRGELLDRSLQDSPTSALVASGDEITARGDRDLYDVAERTPGITSSFGEKGFAIRGVDQRGAGGAGAGFALAVSTQIDGVALPSNQSTFFGPYSGWDVDQVEILIGPQSTQQGRNALAGAVVIRTNDPTFDTEFKLRGEVGSRNLIRYALMANTPLIEDRLAFRFAADVQESDGFVFNTFRGDDEDPRESETYRAKLLFTPNDRFEAVLSASYVENSGGEDLVPNVNTRFVAADTVPIEGSEHTILGLRMTYSFDNGVSLASETNYYYHDFVRTEDTNGLAQPPAILFQTSDSEVFEQDLNLRFASGRFEGVIGLFYTEIDSDQPFTFSSGALSFTNDTIFSVTNYAIFGEVDIAADEILPGLTFTLGARYDVEEFSFTETSVAQVGPTVTRTSNSGQSTFEAFLPKLGATYAFSGNQSVSLTFQSGYRGGGAAINPGALLLPPGTIPVVSDLEPEFSDTVEIAYRGSFYDGLLRVRSNVFYTVFRDQQVRLRGLLNPQDDRFTNAGKSESYGAELTVEGEPTSNLSLFGALALVETKFIRFASPPGTPPGSVFNFNGNAFAGASGVTAAIGGVYAFSDAWSLGVDMAFTEGAFSNNQNTLSSDDRFLVNAQLTYENAQHGVKTALYVRNLFDESYATDRLATGTRTGEPRTIGFYVEKRF